MEKRHPLLFFFFSKKNSSITLDCVPSHFPCSTTQRTVDVRWAIFLMLNLNIVDNIKSVVCWGNLSRNTWGRKEEAFLAPSLSLTEATLEHFCSSIFSL